MEGSHTRTPLCSLPFLVAEISAGVVLKRGTAQILIQGETALESILLILTATVKPGKTPAEICALFPEPRQAEIQALLEEMQERRFLIPADELILSGPEANADVFYWNAGTRQEAVTEALTAQNLCIAGVNRLSVEIYRSLVSLGVDNIRVIDDPLLRNPECFSETGEILRACFEPFPLVMAPDETAISHQKIHCLVATSDWGGQALLLPWNSSCIESGIRFLPVYLYDMVGYVGPLVIPSETACLQCLRMRQNAQFRNAGMEREIEAEMPRAGSVAPIHPSMVRIAAETAVFELLHLFGKFPSPRPGHLITINLPEGHTQGKPVLKIPRCPVCSPLVNTPQVQARKLTTFPDA